MEEFYYLNDIEKEEVRKFVENVPQFEAVKKVLLSEVYFSGVLEEGRPADTRNFFINQLTQPIMENAPIEEYGNHAKALIQGVRFIQTGFTTFGKFRKVEPETEPKKNRGK